MYKGQKLLVANRGEIAVRIIRTARELGLPTVAIYTPSDALSPHVSLADESVPLPSGEVSNGSESEAYLSGIAILSICRIHSVTLLHPGYGFLSENAEFALLFTDAGITWLGPRSEVIKTMGLKHEARIVASRAGLNVVPGSGGLVKGTKDALMVAKEISYPVMLKATAGGGGMGMTICLSEGELRERFPSTRDRAKVNLLHVLS